MKKLIYLSLMSIVLTGCTATQEQDSVISNESTEVAVEETFDAISNRLYMTFDSSIYNLPVNFGRELTNYVTQVEAENADYDDGTWLVTAATYGSEADTLILSLNSEDFRKSIAVTYSTAEDKFLYYSYSASRDSEHFKQLKNTTASYNVEWLATVVVPDDIRVEVDNALFIIASNIGVGSDYKVYEAVTSDTLTMIRYNYTANEMAIAISYDNVNHSVMSYTVTRDTRSRYQKQKEEELEEQLNSITNRLTIEWEDSGPLDWKADDFRRAAFETIQPMFPADEALYIKAQPLNTYTVDDTLNSMLTTKYTNRDNADQYAIVGYLDSYDYVILENHDLLPVVIINDSAAEEEETTVPETETTESESTEE